MTLARLALLTSFFATTNIGCFHGEGDGGNKADAAAACGQFNADSLTTPTPVTRAEIDAVFAQSCSFSTCHGTSPGSGKLYLPKKDAGADDWYAEVLKPSEHIAGMKRVKPGDPNNSFLLIKMDAHGLCFLAPQCNGDAGALNVDGGSCGESMPQGSDRLPDTDVAKVASWIRAGAPPN